MSAGFKIGRRTYRLPKTRFIRTLVGLLLIIGGLLGFLPVVGFWMIPLGIIILSVDWPFVRRLKRRIAVWWGRRGNNGTDN